MTRDYHKWHSPALDREMELLVFGHGGPQMLVFPTRKQRFFEYEDHGMIHAVRHSIEDGRLQLVCVDSIDQESLYCFDRDPAGRIERHLAYERYIVGEVIPFMKKLNPRVALTAHGSSFGAYHAMTIALRHPEHFARVLAFSGRYDLTLNAGDFYTLFHGYYSDELFSIVPSHFVPKLSEAKVLRKLRTLRLTLVCGEDDPFFANNQELVAALGEKKIKSELHAWVGNAHRFRYWRQMLRIYL